jgi:cytoskeleton protein RodZ
MQTISELLRRTRLEQGVELSAIAAQTRIDAKYLRAIEADDIQSLPGAFFYKAFVHQYANYLGLNTKEIDAEIDRQRSVEEPLPFSEVAEAGDEPIPFFARPAAKYVAYGTMALVLAAGMGLDAWLHRTPSAHEIASTPAPEVAAAPVVAPSSEEKPVAPAVVPTSVATKAPATASTTAGKVELALTATEQTWLSVTSDGTPVFSGILQPNETKTIESKETANLKVGNAAGLEVRLNGTPIGSLGAHGQVRDVAFTPDKFHFVSQANQID